VKKWRVIFVVVLVLVGSLAGIAAALIWQDKHIDNPLTGNVVAVSTTTVKVKADSTGPAVTFVNRDTTISPEHLSQHMDEHEPVKVTWHRSGLKRIATAIDDAD
jgi:hypothetical protein